MFHPGNYQVTFVLPPLLPAVGRAARRAGCPACLPLRSSDSLRLSCLTRCRYLSPPQGKWTPEADEALLALVEDKGHRWAEIGAALGRLPEGCRDRWKDIRLGSDVNAGRWSPQEVQALTDAVREYLEAKAQVRRAGGGARSRVCRAGVQRPGEGGLEAGLPLLPPGRCRWLCGGACSRPDSACLLPSSCRPLGAARARQCR